MAALIRLTLDPATQEQFRALDALVGQSMRGAGGSPAGLMSQVAYPSGDGVQIVQLWSTEEQGRAYFDDVLRPSMSEIGLTGTRTRLPFGRSRVADPQWWRPSTAESEVPSADRWRRE